MSTLYFKTLDKFSYSRVQELLSQPTFHALFSAFIDHPRSRAFMDEESAFQRNRDTYERAVVKVREELLIAREKLGGRRADQ